MVESVLPNLRSQPSGGADFEGTVGFWGAFLITLVQGATLNIVLLGYMTVVLAIVWAFNPSPLKSGGQPDPIKFLDFIIPKGKHSEYK